MIPHQALVRSQQVSAQCDAMLVIGTSATVQPAATMPLIAKEHGATIIEINREPVDDLKDYNALIKKIDQGDTVQMLLRRGGGGMLAVKFKR